METKEIVSKLQNDTKIPLFARLYGNSYEGQRERYQKAISKKVLKGRGAVRVHGGGFAGTIQAFVPNELVSEYVYEMEKIFGKDTCHRLTIRPVGGTEVRI